MNLLMVLKSLGALLICEFLALIPSLFVAIYYKGNDIKAFLITMFIALVLGLLAFSVKPKSKHIFTRDGFAIVALGWILISIIGALPFYLSGAIPSFVDSLFEASSGFTTTGATILTEVESLPRGILFWRSFTHWIGGMGVLVLTLAILPSLGTGAIQIMKAESPGPNPGKIVPRLKTTAKVLYSIYLIISILEIVLLLIAGMPLYDALVHTFGTLGTGGFSNMNSSVGAYNNIYIEIIITIFMFISGANFALYYYAFKGNIKAIFKDGEFRFYSGVVIGSIIFIAINLTGSIYSSFFEALRHSSFQVSSIITTTGYATTDFNLWPDFSRTILLLLMFVGGCAGSTAGSIKSIRILLLFKAAKREVQKVLHPRAVYPVRVSGKVVEDKVVTGITVFFSVYIIIFVIGLLLISIEGKDMVTNFSAVATTLGNVGPGLNIVGPMGNFSSFTDFSKLLFSFLMLVGRLEIYPMLLLLLPSFWKKVNI
ncbi:TrkH family potassium uptake protein [Alloiococcus sp. CFN-8]|uniref:TrkH family potassium uptake protein n=1 Tax=Alloiococcus sp. CFN-8 TaxID=3416081 RepID=UPI003CF52B37